jgi:uncharacterized protein
VRHLLVPALFVTAALSCASSPPRESQAQTPARRVERPYTGPVIDLHARLDFDTTTPREGGRPSADVLLEQSRPDRLSTVAVAVLARERGMAATRALNDRLKAFVEQDRRLLAVGSVHPSDGAEAVAEIDRLSRAGFRMIKLDPNAQQLDFKAPWLAQILDKAGEVGLPVLIDFSGTGRAAEITPYLALARTHARTKFILARMGGSRFTDSLLLTELWGDAKPPHNVWLDLSATARLFADSPYAEQLVWVVRQIGIERVLFGSDFPSRMPLAAIEDVAKLGFTQEEQRKIFYVNAATLLGLQAN